MINNSGNQVFVEREPFEMNGKRYHRYFVGGEVRGKEIKIAVVPPDRGGYAVLDIVFGDEDKAVLVAKPFEIKDAVTGRTVKGNTYAVQTWDEYGAMYECTVKPAKPSDRSLLNMLVSRA